MATFDVTNAFTITISSGAVPPTLDPNLPADTTVADGQTANFSVSVTGGTGPYTYQWRENGGNMAGETASTLSFTAVFADNGNTYEYV